MKQLAAILLLLLSAPVFAQPNKNTLKANRDRLYAGIIKSINTNLAQPLTEDTEDDWASAFASIELINYKSVAADAKIATAVKALPDRSAYIQQSLLELLYVKYKGRFQAELKSFIKKTNDPKLFAMAANCILQNKSAADKLLVQSQVNRMAAANAEHPILQQLSYQLSTQDKPFKYPSIASLFSRDYLPGNVLLISIQRKNRNYPGIVLVRDTAGNFVRNEKDSIFSVPQLARSVSNMPSYISGGNTPEGIFRMDGFDTSKSMFIGPTTNVQLMMPYEGTPAHFYKDSAILNWDSAAYRRLLPQSLQQYYSLYGAFFAGKAGRTEIIAHGTTVDPEWYKGNPFYPLTPTEGCLCTKEIWNGSTGLLTESDQKKLAAAITRAGGPEGYAVVINIDDKNSPVLLTELKKYIQVPVTGTTQNNNAAH
jgi:hypothetical protein